MLYYLLIMKFQCEDSEAVFYNVIQYNKFVILIALGQVTLNLGVLWLPSNRAVIALPVSNNSIIGSLLSSPTQLKLSLSGSEDSNLSK